MIQPIGQQQSLIDHNYYLMNKEFSRVNFDPIVSNIQIYDNTMLLGGDDPKGGASEYSQELISGLKEVIGETFPHILYDGQVNENPPEICIRESYTSTNVNLDFYNNFSNLTFDDRGFTCSIDAS